MDEDGLGYQLTKNVSSNECTLTDKHKNKMLFSSAGYLRTITDSNNNVLTIYYDAGSTLISSVIDGAGRKTTFTYNSKKYLSKITDPSGRSTTYSYSSTYNGPISSEEGGFLRTVTYPDGTSTNYTYYSDGTMETAKNSNNIGVQFQYTSDASKRVAKVTEMSGTKAGKNIKFSYLSDGRTTCQATGVDGIMDTSDDLITTYCFDVMGHLTSTYSENINKTAFYDAYAYEYDPDALGTQPINPGNVNKIMKSSKGYKAIPNELLNHSAETDSSWFTINPVSSISYSASRATDCVYIGKSSLKLKVDQATNEKLVMKQEKRELPYGATYTYSAYVNTNDIVASAGDGGAGIYVETVTHTGIKTRKYAEFVTGTTDKNINNGWRKIQVTFTIPQYFYYAELGVELRYAKGTAWFDAMQLEKEETSSAYNLLENSGFENGAWSTLSLTKGQIYTSGAKEGVKCFRFEGNYINKNRISQTVEINKSGTQSYVLSGWAKASSAQSGGNKKFALGATVRYTDGTTKTDELKFNPYNTDWQYVTGAIFPDPAKTVSNITIEAIYDYNVGEACFDSIALVSDLSSTSYTYDAKGNLLSTSQTSKTTYSYTNDNNISKIISPSGYNYQYTYDDKNNLTSVTSEAGVKSDLTYDTYGNPLSVKTGNIINTATYFDGNYLSTIKDTRGKTTYYNYDPTKGLLLNKMDANGIITRYTYDSATDNQISSYIDIDRNGQANAQDPKYSLVYANKRLKTINHNNFNYNLDYNEFGEILSINVNSTKLINYIYKGDNRKRQIVNYYGVSLEYAYDNLFRIISKRYNGNIIYEWKYDTQGNIYKLIDNANKITYNFEYDNGGRLIRQISYSGLNYEIGYDIENRVNKLSYQFGKEPSKTQKITYGQDNRIQSLTLLNNLGTSYNYDSIGRVTSQSLNLNSQGTNKITQNYTYLAGVGTNSTYMVESIEYNKTIGGATSLTGSKLTYTYDALGNIETISEGGVLKLKYYYDNLNQLIKEEDYRINAITTYSYDVALW